MNIPYEIADQVQRELFPRTSKKLAMMASSSSAIVVTEQQGLEAGGGQDVPKSLFDQAYQEIRRLLADGAVRRFCNSDEYFDLLDQAALMLNLPPDTVKPTTTTTIISGTSRTSVTTSSPTVSPRRHTTNLNAHHL